MVIHKKVTKDKRRKVLEGEMNTFCRFFFLQICYPNEVNLRGFYYALLEYFNKLPEADKKIKGNERYRRIMSFLTSPETMVQLYFLETSV